MTDLKAITNTRTIQLGVIQALGGYLFWGFITGIYYKSLSNLSAWELLAWRAIGGFPIAFILLCLPPGIGRLRQALSDRKSVATLLCSTLLIGINWVTFIYAVLNERLVEASLGYFINPLVSVLLARIILGERLRHIQLGAIGIAFAGVITFCVSIIMHAEEGSNFTALPWIPFVLPISFGLYGLLRKEMKADSITGITIEMGMLLPFMIILEAWLMWSGDARFLKDGIAADGLLMLGGLVTVIPLVLFAAGARKLKLTTIGVLQYIAPTCQLILAITIFGETVGIGEICAFVLIWIAVAMYSIESIRYSRKISQSASPTLT